MSRTKRKPVGWTVIGWLGSLIWSASAQARPEPVKAKWLEPEPPRPQIADTKDCPFCAETIKIKAVVCRFCGNDLSGSPEKA